MLKSVCYINDGRYVKEECFFCFWRKANILPQNQNTDNNSEVVGAQ